MNCVENPANEEMDLELGFEDHGISIDPEVSENVQKVLDIKEKAEKSLAAMKAKAFARSISRPRQIRKPILTPRPNNTSQITVVRPQGLVYPAGVTQLQMRNSTTPISVVRQWSYKPGTNQYIIRSEAGTSTVRPTNTISYVRPNISQNQTVSMNQPLIFDPNTGLLLYQGQLPTFASGQSTQMNPVRPINPGQQIRPGVYRQTMNTSVSTFTTTTPPTRMYTARPGIPGTQQTVYPVANSFQTPRIVGTTSIRPIGPSSNLMPPPAPPQTPIVLRSQLTPQQSQPWQRQVSPGSALRSQLNSQSPVQQRLTLQPQRPGVPQPRYPIQQQPQRMPVQTPQRLVTPQQPRLAVAGQQRLAGQQPRLPGQMQPTRLPGQQPTRMPVSQQSKTNPVPASASKAPSQTKYPQGATTSAARPAETKVQTVETPANENDTNNNKTFPSLVVTVKPCLMEKQMRSSLGAARTELDAKAKSLLVLSPQKFTEWLMQRGLLRIEHKCTVHVGDDNLPYPYKLGMYSDNRQPHSGGYVWIADCCEKEKEVSVFQGSIFEASIYPPGTLLKLIYHWSCQTTATNVLQWVKVTSYYLKNFYTLLRSACVAALHEICPVMGGVDKYVEIGIITLGTTLASSTGPRNVKVEILGVFDPSNKIIRLKVINPQNDGVTQATHSRIMQILWPLNHWVNKSSTILIDNSIDRSLLAEMGFKKVQQSKGPPINTGQAKPAIPTNINVMNYLKHVIPKMFQSTLCVLSKSLIQQFLDELSWREVWGGDPSKTFENMLNHLVEMTKWDTGESLISRLNKISLDPFGEWSYSRNLPQGIDMLPSSITGGGDMPLLSIQSPIASKMQNGTSSKPIPSTSSKPKSPVSSKPPTLTPQTQAASGLKRKFTMDLTPFLALEPKNFVLQTYYYGQMEGKMEKSVGTYGGHLKCPLCLKSFTENQEIMTHIYRHVLYGGGRSHIKESCDYCLKDFPSKNSLTCHIQDVHTLTSERYCCRICQITFVSEGTWIIHMWENHDELEMPYICEICNFRSSMQTDVIDHFHKEHTAVDHVICPLCIKTLTVRTVNCIKQIVIHFQNHNLRRNKKCPQCTLLFPTDNEYRHHITVDGAHRGRTKNESIRYILSSFEVASYMPKPPKVPKDKFVLPPQAKKPKLSHPPPPPKSSSLNTFATPIDTDGTFTVEPFDIEIFCDDNSMCLECKQDLESDGHFTGYMTCNKCSYATCCSDGMTNHHTRCHGETKPGNLMAGMKLKPIQLLNEPLKCICGFSSSNPYHITEHLVQCDQPTAFLAKPSAQLNTSSEDAMSPPVLSPVNEVSETVPE